jgi:hypothetical protein
MSHPLREMLGISFPWRLSGLLSGYLPTDTRPQARAKLGKRGDMCFVAVAQDFFHHREVFLWHAPTRLSRLDKVRRASD